MTIQNRQYINNIQGLPEEQLTETVSDNQEGLDYFTDQYESLLVQLWHLYVTLMRGAMTPCETGTQEECDAWRKEIIEEINRIKKRSVAIRKIILNLGGEVPELDLDFTNPFPELPTRWNPNWHYPYVPKETIPNVTPLPPGHPGNVG